MGNANKVSIVNESKYALSGELISQQLRFPIALPYKQKVEFDISSYHSRNVIAITHSNGEQFGVTHFCANSGDSDHIQITDTDILFNGKSRFQHWDKPEIEKWLSQIN